MVCLSVVSVSFICVSVVFIFIFSGVPCAETVNAVIVQQSIPAAKAAAFHEYFFVFIIDQILSSISECLEKQALTGPTEFWRFSAIWIKISA